VTTAPDGATELPDVAVILITYNHETFIAESINSVLRQEYPGTIHVIVSDDCSTDQTQKVIKETTTDVPPNVIVHSVLREQNVGGLRNLTEAWESANETGSAYIALLEGDDYWTDSLKLALQVSYMEEHPRSTMSFGLATELILRVDAPPSSKVVVIPPSDHLTFAELLCGNFIHTCTVVYRRGVLLRFPEWFAGCAFRDWPLHLVHASAGEIHYMDRVVAVHRQHQSSKWWNPTRSKRDQVRAAETVQRLAITHLGTKANFRRSQVVAARHRWWATASRNRSARWAHTLIAITLDPRLVRRRLRRRFAALTASQAELPFARP
jgi:glycosyltransferase involved in cell wall biosynthesis